MEKLAIDVHAAAAALSISPFTVRKWIREKKLPVLRIGRRVLVPVDALKAVVQSPPETVEERSPQSGRTGRDR